MAKAKGFTDKDFKTFMSSLYTRVKPILKESNSNLEKMIKELNDKIISDDAKKLVKLITNNYRTIFLITVKAVGEIVKTKGIKVSTSADFDTISSAAKSMSMNTNIETKRMMAKIKIPPGMLKLYSLLMNISRKIKKLTPTIKELYKNFNFESFDESYEADFDTLSYLLALQDTIAIIGAYKVDKNKGRKLVESHKKLAVYLKNYCIKSKKVLDQELEKAIKIQKDVHKKLEQFEKKKKNGEKITQESYIYVNPYAQEYLEEGVLKTIAKPLKPITKPVAKLMSWMFDSAYYFFKKTQPLFLWIKTKYDAITATISSFVFKPLYKINPLMATIAETFLSPFTIPAMVKIAGFFFGGIPGLFVTNLSIIMGVVNSINSYATIDVRAASAIDSAISYAKQFSNIFGNMAKTLEDSLGDIDDLDLDSMTMEDI